MILKVLAISALLAFTTATAGASLPRQGQMVNSIRDDKVLFALDVYQGSDTCDSNPKIVISKGDCKNRTADAGSSVEILAGKQVVGYTEPGCSGDVVEVPWEQGCVAVEVTIQSWGKAS
ncbi:hypothetical protein EJ04DRAFT_569609 [Polyplosphaeria fusca]|uniref:Uncharacterized protein n=1 Tax=Polyplosphaeria fusca TaxID=682080 RepID=A0A9P4UVM0_9PLEO|nr:hypothetical protein EJ04DRAFT_569609 [Polyplosphaeria fusca]